jgi:hypothetical protein
LHFSFYSRHYLIENNTGKERKMQNGITLAEYYNAFSDKAADVIQLSHDTHAVLKEELSDDEYQQAMTLTKHLHEGNKIACEANSEQFMLLNSELYIDADTDPDDAAPSITKKGCIDSCTLTYGTDLTRTFTGIHEKIMRAEIKTWNRAEDQSPKIQNGQLIKRSDRLSM